MYRDDYDYDPPPPSRYRDYLYERERYDERERPLRSSYGSPLDDTYYRGRRPDDMLPLPRPKEPLLGRFRMEDTNSYIQGSVTITPPPLFQSKPPLRDKPPKCNTVFVGTLPESITEKHLYDIFCECGSIQDIRISRSRTFGHVEFKYESAVDKAIQFNGFTITINGINGEESSSIQVDYAQSRESSDAKRRMKSGEFLVFNAPNAHIISSDLRNDDTFEFASKNLIQWMEKGSCSPTTANTFFGLLSTVNTHCHKLEKDLKSKEEEHEKFLKKKIDQLQDLLIQCDGLESVFDASMQKRAWDNFTKPQRKTITQWKEHIQNLIGLVKTAIKNAKELRGKADEPAAKKMKSDHSDSNVDEATEAKLSRAEREIEQLKVDREIAIEKKEKQILQLKTLLARFKQNCPDEWEKVVGGGGGGSGSNENGQQQQQQDPEQVIASQNKDENNEENEGDNEGEWEVIDGVNMDDLNRALDGGSLGENTLAAAAAAYAQLRTQIGSKSEETGLGLSEHDIALSAVMATFLTVHPLGASLEEIEFYFQTLNSTYNSIYLESLLQRLPKVFQLSKAANGQPRWWFLGFQTVSMPQYGAVSEQDTIEMVDVDKNN